MTAFDEMKGTDGQVRPAYAELSRWLARGAARRARLPPARGRAPVPPHRHHLCGLRRRGRAGAPDPVRRHPAHPVGGRMGARARGLEQRVKAINLYIKDIYGAARDPARRRRARRPGVPESGLPAGDERPEGAARHLCAYRRHRHRAGRRRRVLRAGGQCAHALRRLLHAGEPRDHAAAVSGAVLAPPRRAGRELSRRTARHAEIGGAAYRRGRPDRRAAHARASTTPPITSIPSSPTSSASNWSRAATSSSRTRSCTCARPRARSAST